MTRNCITHHMCDCTAERLEQQAAEIERLRAELAAATSENERLTRIVAEVSSGAQTDRWLAVESQEREAGLQRVIDWYAAVVDGRYETNIPCEHHHQYGGDCIGHLTMDRAPTPPGWRFTCNECGRPGGVALAAPSPGAERAAAVERVIEAAREADKALISMPDEGLDMFAACMGLHQALATLDALDGGAK